MCTPGKRINQVWKKNIDEIISLVINFRCVLLHAKMLLLLMMLLVLRQSRLFDCSYFTGYSFFDSTLFELKLWYQKERQ